MSENQIVDSGPTGSSQIAPGANPTTFAQTASRFSGRHTGCTAKCPGAPIRPSSGTDGSTGIRT